MPNPIGKALRNRRAGHDALAWARRELQAPENFILTSPDFAHGDPMPEKLRGHVFGKTITPALAWTDPPKGTAELVLIVQDPDVPRAHPSLHLVSAGIDPALDGIPEDGLTNPSPLAGLTHGRGALGHLGWAGPMPIPSHGPHAYVFQLFALDKKLDLPPKFRLEDALVAMTGHIIGRARLDGTFENP